MTFIRTNKMIVISLILVLFLGVGIFYSTSLQKPYGNDEESIIEVIQSLEGYHDGLIEILEVKDIEDNRIVAFLANNTPAYILFSTPNEKNYTFTYKHFDENGKSVVEE